MVTDRGCSEGISVGQEDTSERNLEALHTTLATLGSLRHPNLVGFLGASLSASHPPRIVLELCQQDLHDVISRTRESPPLPLPAITDFALDVTRALHLIHASALVHGSLSPSKIMVSPQRRAKLLFTAFASASRSTESSTETPESRTDGDPQDDIDALGAIICAMATGTMPAPNTQESTLEGTLEDIPWPRLRAARRCMGLSGARPATDELIGMLKLLRS